MYDKKLQRRLILGVNRKGILLLKPADNVATNAMVRGLGTCSARCGRACSGTGPHPPPVRRK